MEDQKKTKAQLLEELGELRRRVEALEAEKSKRMQVEQALQASEEKWLSLAQNAPELISALDREGRILFINRDLVRLKKEQIVGTHIYDHLPPEGKTVLKSALDALFESGEIQKQEYCAISPEGSKEWYTVSLVPLMRAGEITEALFIGSNITNFKEIEQALRESEERYHSLFENSPISLWEEDFSQVKVYIDELKASGVRDLERYFDEHPEAVVHCASLVVVIDVNQATLDMAQAHQKEDLLKGLDETFGQAAYRTFQKELLSLASGATTHTSENTFRTLQGEAGHSMVQAAIAPGYEETWGKVFVSVMDITERVQAEQMLQESEEHLHSVVETAIDAIIVIDDQSNIVSWNHGAEKMFGYSEAEANGQLLSLMMPKRFREDHYKAVSRVVSGGHPRFIGKTVELVGLKKEGLEFPIEISLASWQSGAGKFFTGIIRDITERKRAEEALIASQKLAGLGTLAAGIAHEINSPLQIITGTSETAARRLRDGQVDEKRLLRNMDSINHNAWRVARIIRSLLTYARATYEETEPHDLNEIIQDTLLMIEHQLRTWSNINVTSHLAEDLPTLHCERNSIAQVLINLLTNARDAMPKGGEINIRTRYDAQKGHLVLQVSDNGPGIPAEVRSKIFDPFFTTKPVGEGTELGLSIVMGIVQAHGGEVRVDSEPGQGTTFTVSLPEEPPEKPVSSENRDGMGRFDE